MLNEYAIIFDVFDETCYSESCICEVHLSQIKDALLHDSIVRNLYSGQWGIKALENSDRFHLKAKELLKKIKKQDRLILFKALGEVCPCNDEDWLQEAIHSHQKSNLNGIITNVNLKSKYNDEIVGSIENIRAALWWQSRGNSKRLVRQTVNYLNYLYLILQHSNSLMFIDPYLDPSRRGYSEFIEILKKSKRVDGVNPTIEIHKVCYEGSGPGRTFPTNEEWKHRFSSKLGKELKNISLKIEVFIWDDFHDRYLISNLLGISCPNGFDITTNEADITTWTKLDKVVKDDVQREFDPASNRHQLKYKFQIPE